jgi:hypothetical protein
MSEQERLKRAEEALVRIFNDFDNLNGKECTQGCGECVRCIAAAGLGVRWGTNFEDPPGGILAISPKLYEKALGQHQSREPVVGTPNANGQNQEVGALGMLPQPFKKGATQ